MKTFGCLVALVGLTIGFASAGPVAVSGGSGQSMCDIQCSSQNKFKYLPGKSYVYKYSTKTETALEQSSDEKSTIYLDADISLHVIDSCRFALKVDSAKLDEEISGGGRKASRGTQELAAALTKSPLIFNFENGLVSRLCPHQQESKTALNIKRGILSMIQNKMFDFSKTDVTSERDVNGECRATYTAAKDWGGLIRITKEKVLSECKRDNEHQVLSVIALPRQVAKSSSMINGTQECRQTIKNAIFDSVECHERHVVKPFSHQGKGAATEIHQNLKYQRSGADIPADALRYAEGQEETLLFDPTHEAEIQDSQAEGRARALLNRLANEKHTDIKEMNNEFIELLETVRKMRHDALKKLAADFKTNQWLIDALAGTLTRDAMKVFAELVKERVVPTDLAQRWLITVGMTSDVDIERIQILMPLLDMDELAIGVHLAVSSVARTYMDENPSEVPQEITDLLRKLYAQLKFGAPTKMLTAALKAIGNIGISTGHEEKFLEVSAKMGTETRLAAIEAFRRLPCERVKRNGLMNIFTQTSEETEVRVAAYLNSIICPTEKMIATIKETLRQESRGSPLASFVYTHVKNLEKRSSFNQDVSLITSDETLKSLELDSNNFSKNYYYEMFFNPLDMGFEIDAGSIMTNEMNTLMLNTTFDMFGHKANIFDTKVRFNNDMTHRDALARYFGNEVFYASWGRQSNSEMDIFLKSVMSRNGWKYSRSMMLLDAEMIVPTGSGLPLVVGINGTGTLDFDLKAMPLQGQRGSNYVAEIRSAPSVAMQFGISMMMKAPQTNSGIKMVVTSSSQWDLNGRVNIDLTDSRMVRNIQIEAPRERSDLIDIRSDVYLVGGNSQRAINAVGTAPKHFEMCTGHNMHILIGHKACVQATYPQASLDDSPFFMLRGPSHFNVRWVKTDKTLKMFHIQSSFIYGQNDLIELAFEMDTPGSQIDRKFKGRLYNDRRNHKFGLDLISPLKSLAVEGAYEETSNDRKTALVLKIDNKPELQVMGNIHVVNGRAMIMSPTLEISTKNGQLVAIKSQIASHGNQKFNGDVELRSIFTTQPIKMNAEYSVVNNDKRLTFGLDSEWMKYGMQSSVSQQDRNFHAVVKGDYSYNQGAKNTFSLGGKLLNDQQTLAMEVQLERNQKTFVSARGKLDLVASPNYVPNFDAALELLQGRYKGSMSFKTENSKSELIAMAVIDNENYQTRVRFNREPRLTSLSAVLGLPNNVERKLKLQYDLASPVKRLVVETDLTGKSYGARVSYMPSEKLHKVSAQANMDKEMVQLTATLGTDPVYQTSLDIVHNGAKLLSSSLGVNVDRNKPDVKVYLQLRDKALVDLATDTRVERGSVTVGVKMLAPIELNANVGLKKSGSIADTLSLGTEIEVNSPDRRMNMALSSSADVSLGKRTNKLNAQASVTLPGGTSEIVFSNVLDASSWSVDWSYKGPSQQKHHVQSSGTYNFEAPKLHLRGGLDMDIRPLDLHIKVENLALDTQLSLHENEVDFKTEIVTKNENPALLVSGRMLNGDTIKQAGFEVNVLGKMYHLKLELDGKNLNNGWRTTVDAKVHDKTITGNGNLRWDGQFILVDLELQTSYEEFAKTKILLQTQTFDKTSTLLNAELALGQYFAKSEVIIGKNSLEADVRTSIPDWQNVKAQANWELKPKVRVNVHLSSAKYPNNVIEFEMEHQNGVTARLRVTAPSIYSDTLLDGNLRYSKGEGVATLLHKGEQKARMTFNLRNEDVVKMLSTDLTYNMNGAADRWNFVVSLESGATKIYDAKMSLRKNSDIIFDVNYLGALNTHDDLFIQNRVEIQTSLPRIPPRMYLLNKFTLTQSSMHTQHEIGTSPKYIHYSVDVSGELVNDRDLFVLTGKLDGKWERVLAGSVSAELKTNRHNIIQWGSRVESNKALVCSSRVSLLRRERVVDLDVEWDAPKIERQGLMSIKSGIEQPEAFVFRASLERDQNVDKSALVHFRLPLQTKKVDGVVEVKMPRELGSQSLVGNLLAKKSMLNINGKLSLGGSMPVYAGEFVSQWDQEFTVNGKLSKDNTDIGRLNLRASSSRPGIVEIAADAKLREVSYKTKVKGALKDARMNEDPWRSMDISMEAESSHWQRKHLLRASYSLDDKTGSLKVDIAKLNILIESLMSHTYVLRGTAHYDGENIADVTLNYNPNTRQGDMNALVSGKRMTSNFIARLQDGEFKMDLPTGASSLNWNLDNKDKMSLNGLWTFRSQNWRLEAYVDPRENREAEAKLFYKGEHVGSVYGKWKPDQVMFRIHSKHSGEEHYAELGVVKEDGVINAILKVNCPWLRVDPIDASLRLEYSDLRRVIVSTVKIDERTYSLKANGHITGDRISGIIETHCHYDGDMKINLEGTFGDNGFKVKLTSDKLKQPIEIDGMRTHEKIAFRVKTQGYEMDGNIHKGEKIGVELLGKDNGRVYELVAVAENRKSLKIAIQTPQIAKTGLNLIQNAPGNYGVDGDWLGKKVLEAKWTGTPENMKSGVLSGMLDLGTAAGKHNVIISYNLLNTPKLKVEVDGQVIFDGSFDHGNHRVLGKLTLKSAQNGDLTVEFKHQLSPELLMSSLKLSSQANKALGYEVRLHKEVLGSMVRIDTPKRVVLMEVDKKQDNKQGLIVGRVAWDHGRDAQKTVEFQLSPEQNNNGQREQQLMISIPKLGEKLFVTVHQNDDGYLIQALRDERSTRAPRMSLQYSKQGKLQMTLGNLLMRTQVSSKKSELVVRRMNAQEDDLSVGYSLQGKTLSARLNWTPSLLANSELTARNILDQLQRGPDNKLDRQMKKIFDYIEVEITSIEFDIITMLDELRKLYEQNAWHLKSVFETVVRTAGRMASYYESATENMREMMQDLKRIINRYTQRLAVASTVISAIQQEITEDFIDSLQRWFARVEKSITNEQLRNIVQRIFRFVRQDYEVVVDWFDTVFDEYVCEFSSEQTHLTNKRCGFAYGLNSLNQQHGVMMRLPVPVMQS